jgi:hypothetical protein
LLGGPTFTACGDHNGLLGYQKVKLKEKGDRPRIRHKGLLWAMPESQAVEKKPAQCRKKYFFPLSVCA